MRRLFHTARTASPVRDLGLVYLIALAVLRRQTWDLANRAVDVNDATADATDQVVMVVADPRFESGRGSRWLNATDESLANEDAERVIYRLQRDGADFASNRLRHRIGCDVGLSGDHAVHGQSLRRDLQSSLAQARSGIGVHPNILDQILESFKDWKETMIVAGVPISHPDRLIYPDLGISKVQLARYYEDIADWIVPHVAGRPLTLVHCPAGVAGPCRYLKHAKAWGPGALRRVKIQEKTKVGEYLVADSLEAVVSLAQMGIVEVHTWNSTADDIEHPDRIVWDLDPGPAVSWKQTVEAAGLVRDVLKTLGLRAWVKTTGGRGLHVVVPLKPQRTVAESLQFSRAVSETLVRADPRLYTIAFAKRGRERKILIDYLRNNRTNTSICAFSPRARAGAPVSMPIDWRDLDTGPERWTLPTVRQYLKRRRADPWAHYWRTRQEITDASFAAIQQL
jgi:DNA ligase D